MRVPVSLFASERTADVVVMASREIGVVTFSAAVYYRRELCRTRKYAKLVKITR